MESFTHFVLVLRPLLPTLHHRRRYQHTFWDCETWMYPGIALLHPPLARSLLQYRSDRLGAAFEKAATFDPPYKGAMFPWESAQTGMETIPAGNDEGKLELHISSDIVLAMQQYYRLTHDMQWLRAVGWPIVAGVADFWVSRVTVDATDGSVHIRDVQGPDENHEHVDDSVYTNAGARLALEFATEAAGLLGVAAQPAWAAVAARLVLLFNESSQTHPEYLGYPWGEPIKQADAVMLAFPLGVRMSAAARRADLDYYGRVTVINAPAMTWGMHVIGYLELRDFARAASFFNRSFANQKEPFGIWTETPTGGATNFATGQGGFLQTVLFGWPGARIHADALSFDPRVPDGARVLAIRSLFYRAHAFNVTYTSERVEISVRAEDAEVALCAVLAADGSSPLPLIPNAAPVSFATGPFSIRECASGGGGLSTWLKVLIGVAAVAAVVGTAFVFCRTSANSEAVRVALLAPEAAAPSSSSSSSGYQALRVA